MLDHRLNAARPDLADARLKGRVKAKRFVKSQTARVSVGKATLSPKPEQGVSIDTELLYGETVDVFERNHGWAWVQAHLDGYVGYVKEIALGPSSREITHTVSALRTFIYSEPNLKSRPLDIISMNARLSISDATSGEFHSLHDGGWVFGNHIASIGGVDTDHCSVALRFVGTPYLWGGRTSVGLDCSALVQLSLMRCGINVPRDSDMQENSLGREAICEPNLSDLRRGDIVYWNGHCGIWINEDAFIHANATDMAVTVQPIKRICQHIAEATGDGAPRVRRPK